MKVIKSINKQLRLCYLPEVTRTFGMPLMTTKTMNISAFDIFQTRVAITQAHHSSTMHTKVGLVATRKASILPNF